MLIPARRDSRSLASGFAAVACVIAACLGPAPAALAERGHESSHGKPAKTGDARGHGNSAKRTDATRPDDDRRAESSGRTVAKTDARDMRRWFETDENLASLPPGLAKRESLPPGLRKQIVRNGALPPGLQQRLEPLPSALEARLPPLPSGVRRAVAGRDVLLIDDSTQKILDIVRNVLPR